MTEPLKTENPGGEPNADPNDYFAHAAGEAKLLGIVRPAEIVASAGKALGMGLPSMSQLIVHSMEECFLGGSARHQSDMTSSTGLPFRIQMEYSWDIPVQPFLDPADATPPKETEYPRMRITYKLEVDLTAHYSFEWTVSFSS